MRRGFCSASATALINRQRLQQFAATAHRTQQQCSAGDQGNHADAFPEAGQPLGIDCQRFQRMQEHCGDDQQRRPQQHLHDFRQQRRDQPDCHRKQGNTKEPFDRIHPAAGPGQQSAGRESDQQQRHAHTDGQREQRDATQHDIAGLADIEQCASQRRRDTRSDDQGRDGAHDEHAGKAAALNTVAGFGKTALQKAGHLQFEETKHG